MVISTESPLEHLAEEYDYAKFFAREYGQATVYADVESETAPATASDAAYTDKTVPRHLPERNSDASS